MRELLIPLFPLEVVLFPSEILPLHIFEDRYKQMIAECLAKREHAPAEAEFGIVCGQGEDLQAVGCTAGITEVIRRYEDGRLDILTVGRRRFETLFTNTAKPYLRGAVAFFDDDDPGEPAGSEVERARSLLGEVLRRLKVDDDQVPAQPGSPGPVSFQLAARLPLGIEFKQQILVLRSERERLRRLTDAMQRLIPALDFRNKVRAKASGNGHAKPGGAAG